MKPPLAKKHTGMRIDCEGALTRIQRRAKLQRSNGDAFVCEELLRHLKVMSTEYYAGNIAIVDEFLQLYCLDDARPKEGEV